MNDKGNAYRIFVGKSDDKRPLGILKCRWEDNIKIDFREIRYEGVDWIHVVRGSAQWWAHVNTVMGLWFQKRWGTFDQLID
jgi:hypothetical protein